MISCIVIKASNAVTLTSLRNRTFADTCSPFCDYSTPAISLMRLWKAITDKEGQDLAEKITFMLRVQLQIKYP